jgi:hypothetical protein
MALLLQEKWYIKELHNVMPTLGAGWGKIIMPVSDPCLLPHARKTLVITHIYE